MEKRKNSENILLRNIITKIFYFMKSPCKNIMATVNDMNPTWDIMNELCDLEMREIMKNPCV